MPSQDVDAICSRVEERRAEEWFDEHYSGEAESAFGRWDDDEEGEFWDDEDA